MPIHYFPANFVYWKNAINHDKIKARIVPKIEELHEEHKNNHMGLGYGYTSYFKTSMEIERENLFLKNDSLLMESIWDAVDETINYLRKNKNGFVPSINKSIMTKIWYSYYDKGGYHGLHSHDSVPYEENGVRYTSSFSVVYVLKDESPQNVTMFKQLDRSMPLISEKEYIFDTRNESTIKEGSILVFPAGLYHEVKEVMVGKRMIIAVDIMSDIGSNLNIPY
jgi:hypothetical protein